MPFKDVTEPRGERATAVCRRLRGQGCTPGFDQKVSGCWPRLGLPVKSAVASYAHLPRATTLPVTVPCRLPPAAPPRWLPRTWAGATGASSPAGGVAWLGAWLWRQGRTLEMWAWRVVGGGVIRAALGLRAAPSRAGGSGRGARQRRGDWLRRAETSGSRGPSGRPARRGAVGSSGLVTESCSRPCRPPPLSLGCAAAAVARTRRRAPRRLLQPRGLRSPRLPHAHHDED